MSNRPHIFGRTACLALFALLALLPWHLRAEGTQPHRDLLIFELSPTMKKDQAATRETLAKLFASNMDNEMHPGDDIAVWTVDDGLHSATDLISSWEPEEAAIYTGKVWEFLSQQKYSRHASLAPIEPSLDRVMRKCQHLTVLIFCDSNARLQGTPFDAEINEDITNTAAKFKGGPIPLVVVMRAYNGEYIGSSVNRTMPFNFPKFPAPAKSTAPVVTASATTSAPPKRIEGPIVKPIPAMIIVGTNAGTDISMLTNTPPPRPAPVPPPPPKPSIATPPAQSAATNAAAVPAMPAQPSASVAATPSAPPPSPTPTPAPAPVPAAPQVAPSVPPAAPPVVAQSNNVFAASAAQQRWPSTLVPLIIGVGALATALVIVGRIVSTRRPRSSLITSSMHDEQKQPPQK